jgi:hypothetical protein
MAKKFKLALAGHEACNIHRRWNFDKVVRIVISEENNQDKIIQERMADEALVKEKIDDEGNRWTKVYLGGGEHFKGWLAQCKELGEVQVEEAASTGYKCFEEAGEKLYRIWVKMDAKKGDDLF